MDGKCALQGFGNSPGNNPRREESDRHWTFSNWTKTKAKGFLDPVAGRLHRTGLHPNTLSIAGFVLAVASGIAIAGGYIALAGWLFLLSGSFDALDGALARTAGMETRFGAFLDSFLDRYADASVLLALIYWFSLHDHHGLVVLSASALLGSVMVSYARARAEGLGVSCSIGLFTRLERFLVVVLTLFTGHFLAGITLLAVLSNLTAVQRLRHVYKQSRRI